MTSVALAWKSKIFFTFIAKTSGLRDQPWSKCNKLYKVWGLLGDILEAGYHSHVGTACFLLQPVLVSLLPFSGEMALLDSTVTYPLNSPLIRFTKVGRWHTQGQPGISSNNFIPAWKYTDSKDRLSKSSSEYMGRLSRNFCCFPGSCSFHILGVQFFQNFLLR